MDEKDNKYFPKKIFIRYWLPFFIWAAIIFMFSNYQTTRASEIHWKDFIIKKSAHLVEYSMFTLLLYRALVKSKVDKKKAIIISVITAIIYGVSDEYHQSFTPGREPRLRDVAIDSAGSFFTAVFIKKLAPKLKGKPGLLMRKIEIV